jgi:hypothetical protein
MRCPKVNSMSMIKNAFHQSLVFLLPFFVAVSIAMITQQFILHDAHILHHAYFCAVIFVLAAFYAEKSGKTPLVKLCVGFALCGMSLGVLEVLSSLIQPAFAAQSCLGAIIRL